jgi:lysophospholipase L1-like esterase
MKKKIIVGLLIILLCAAPVAGCLLQANTMEGEKLHILILGDSIAEGIAGMVPVSERERDAYYGLIGQRNDYDYKNRAISGSRSRDLLARLKATDEDGIRMSQALVHEADIIHVSILGNDLLLADIGKILTEVASNNYTTINGIIETARSNIAQIFECLEEQKKEDAVIFFQTVYNPVFENSTLISPSARATLAEMGIQPSQYRDFTNDIVESVNAVVHEYLEAHPGAFYLMDGFAEFERIYQENPERGKDMIFVDDAHPSSEGHAVMADMTQAKLEELGLADAKKALKKYKEMRIEQINRLYSKEVDVKEVVKQIKKAKSCAELTEYYYNVIAGKTPDYLYKTVPTFENRRLVEEDTVFHIDRSKSHLKSFQFDTILTDESQITLRKDGTASLTLMVNTVMLGLGMGLIGSGQFSIDPTVLKMVYAYLPGIDLYDLPKSFDILKGCLGISFIGLNPNNAGIQALFGALVDGKPVSADVNINVPSRAGLELNANYYIKELTSSYSGITYTGVFWGNHDADGEAFIMMELWPDEATGGQKLIVDAPLMNIHIEAYTIL